MIVNTVQFRFPPTAPRPTWVEIAGFVRQLDTDVSLMETVYKSSIDRSLCVKFVSMHAMQDSLEKNMEPRKFQYSSGMSVEVKMTIAGNNVRYVRVFDLPPELPDNELKQCLLEYGKVDRVIREKFPPNLGLDHMYTGVRGVYIDVEKEIPASLSVSNWKGKVFYQDLRNKCFLCRAEGHRKDACPQRKAGKKESSMQVGERKTYSGVVIGFGAATKATKNDVVEVAEEDVVVLDTDSTERSETFEIPNSMMEREKLAETMEFKNNTDRIWFVKKGVIDYTDCYRKMRKEEEKKQQAQATSQRRDRLVTVGSIDRSPPKKTSRRNASDISSE